MEIIYNQIFHKLSETGWCYWRQAARAANHASSWCLHCCRALGINFYNSCLWEWYVKAVGYRKWHIPGYLYGDKKRCCRRIWLKYKRQSASDPGSWHFWASASARGDCRGCKRGEHNWPSKFILWCVTGGWIYLCFLLASVLHSRNMSSNQVSFYFYLPISGWSRCLCLGGFAHPAFCWGPPFLKVRFTKFVLFWFWIRFHCDMNSYATQVLLYQLFVDLRWCFICQLGVSIIGAHLFLIYFLCTK